MAGEHLSWIEEPTLADDYVEERMDPRTSRPYREALAHAGRCSSALPAHLTDSPARAPSATVGSGLSTFLFSVPIVRLVTDRSATAGRLFVGPPPALDRRVVAHAAPVRTAASTPLDVIQVLPQYARSEGKTVSHRVRSGWPSSTSAAAARQTS